MKKIISILVALGLVLSLVVMAAPASAQTCTATVTGTTPFCASETDTYNIVSTSPVTLLPGNDLLSVDFAEGTSLVGVTAAGVTVNTFAVSSVVISDTHIEFPVPVLANIVVGDVVTIVIAGVINPADDGAKTLDLNYKLSCCDAVVFDCAEYTIAPAKSSYKFVLDFGVATMYPGIAEDFIPPFKACGQEDYGWLNATRWYSEFDMTLMTDVEGCAGYNNVTINFELVSAPTNSTVTLGLFDATLSIWFWWSLQEGDNSSWGPPVVGFPLPAAYTVTTPGRIHFDTVGDYEICLNATSPTALECLPPGSELIIERCMKAKVYQWKDVCEIPLHRKWNLISLPLVPFVTDIDTLLLAYPALLRAEVDSIWNYDRNAPNCNGDWKVWDGGGLTDMYDGKSYWVKVDYDNTDPDPDMHAGAFHGFLWVWGTEKPVPPNAPSAYDVCEGWNMVGFTSMTGAPAKTYLANWDTGATKPEPVIYGWNHGCFVVQKWNNIDFQAGNLVSGQGYWMAFPSAGQVFQVVP
ncbi:MAG: hypothetical protein KAX25_00720 [Dehalococcoidia bacterium]|nr:hypothetical protein [Dehalococcoidia bacterium]